MNSGDITGTEHVTGADHDAVKAGTGPTASGIIETAAADDPDTDPLAAAAADDDDPASASSDTPTASANLDIDSATASAAAAPETEAAPPQGEVEVPPAQEAGEGGEVFLYTLLDTELDEYADGGGGAGDVGDGGAEGEVEHITLHSGSVASDGPAKIETRLAVREALLPTRRSGRPRARPARCRACGGPPGRGAGGYCDDCSEAAEHSRRSSAEDDDVDGGGEGPAVPPCADCGRLFDTVSSLVSHRANEHPGRPHGCPFCSKVFQRRTDLKGHMNLHLGIKKSVCDVCGRQFSHMSNLYRHRRIHTGERPYVCSVCGRRFSQANALNAHMQTHMVKSSHDCPFCPKRFRNRPRLTCHIRLMHQSAAQPERRRIVGRQFHCCVCGSRLDSLAKLQRHLARHPADSLRCVVCQETFSTPEELTRHGCAAAAGRPDEDEEVVDLVSDGEEPETAAVPGPRRPDRSSYMLSDSRERKEEESAGLLAAAEQDPAEVDHLMDEMVAVQNVGTQYDVSEILNLTETERLASPPPQPLTPLTDDAEQHLDIVIDGVARGELVPPDEEREERPFACATCGRLFSRVHNLRQHEAMHDASRHRYECPECDKTFAWQQTRDRHLAKKHGDGVKRVECPECDKTYLPDSLPGHVRRIHRNVKTVKCQHCPKSFFTRSELNSHLRTHTQERPFVCCTCARQFSQLNHLRRHEEMHRRVQKEAAETDRPDIRYTYFPRRIAPQPRAQPPPPPADIVKHSMKSAQIPLKVEGASFPPGTQLLAAAPVAAIGQMAALAPVTALTPLAPAGTDQQAVPQLAMSGAQPSDDVVTAVVGPECKEIIIVECEV